MNTKGLAAKMAKLLAFATAMLMVSSFGIEFFAIGLVLGVAYAAYKYGPFSTSTLTKRSRSGLNDNLVMLAIGALAVFAVALMFWSLPGLAPIAGADELGARAPATYKGVEYCKTCHGPGGFGGDLYTGWLTTNHGIDFTNRSYHGAGINIFTQSGGSCQKCHVVAYNQTAIGGWDPAQPWNGSYNSKLQGIQCESCHGPGSEHVGGESGIIADPTPAQSCAGDGASGCHGPAPGHGTTVAWNESLHSPANEKALETPEHYMNTNCAKCHSPSQYDPAVNSSNPAYNISKDDFRGVSCGDCHDMHSGENEGMLKSKTLDDACMRCHTTDKLDALPGKSPGHRSNAQIFLGVQGANVTGTKGMPGVTCVDCHMFTTPSPARGVYLSDIKDYPYPKHESHDFTASAEACANCHSDLILSMPNATMPKNNLGANATMYAAWEKWMPLWLKEVDVWETVIEDWQAETEPLLASATSNTTLAKAAIDSAKANKTKDNDTIARATALWGDAYWNYRLVESDPSMGVHNHDFELALLRDALTKSKQVLDMMSANSAPVANAGVSKITSTNQPVIFNASASSDMDGTIVSYFWDFGDGTNSTDKVATHGFSDSGLYYVRLTVRDNRNASASATINVFVNNVAPRADAGDDQTVALDSMVIFNASGSWDSDGTIVNYTWDLGDGTVDYGPEVTHTYTKAKAYALILTATDDDGDIGIDTVVVNVVGPGFVNNAAPIARAGNDATTSPLTNVSFNAFGSTDPDGTIVNYTWSFGDGAFGYGVAVDHSYARPGAYAVILTVTDNIGATGIDISVVTVERPVEPPVERPVDLGPLENSLNAIRNDTSTLKTDLGNTKNSMDAVQSDTAAMKKDLSDTKQSVDSAASVLGSQLIIVLLVALVAALVLHLVAGKETGVLRRELQTLRAQVKKGDVPSKKIKRGAEEKEQDWAEEEEGEEEDK
jgi:predicted CXXCH cytochrome family protein